MLIHEKVKNTYDAVGHVIEVRDANGNRTSMVYNGQGNLVEVIDSLNRRATYSYDAMGSRSSRIDARNQITSYSYDALHRVTTVAYTGGALVTYQYDARSLQTLLADKSGLYTMSYDALGRIVNVQDSVGAILTNVYDPLGRRTNLVEANNYRTTWSYLGNLRQVRATPPNNASVLDTVNGVGQLSNRRFVETSPFLDAGTTYDKAGRLQRQQITKGATNAGDYSASFDRAGNITQITESLTTGIRTTYTYDAANQLLTEWRQEANGYRATYTYDGAGNRLTKVEVGDIRTTYVYDAANQLSSEQTGAITTNYSYDQNGNQILKDEGGGILTTYTWDEENRLTNVAYPGGALSTYLYSADGLRRKREETDVSVLEVWDGMQLLQEKDANTGGETARYLLQNSSYSGLRAQKLSSDGIWRYFGTDMQGSTRLLLNADGTSNLSLLYRAFGEKQASSGAGSTLFQFGAFYGYEWDTNSRMWVKARHLNGSLGTWLSNDPIVPMGSDPNLKRYAHNNPLTGIDAWGLFTMRPSCTGRIPVHSSVRRWCSFFNSNFGNPFLVARIGACVRTSSSSQNPCDFTADNASKYITSCNRLVLDCCAVASNCKAACWPDCPQKKPNKCAYTWPTGSHQCHITLCMNFLANPDPHIATQCLDNGARNQNPLIPPIDLNILHELGHCSGIDHGTDNNNVGIQCNTVVACCIASIDVTQGNRRSCLRR
jgi:RHS repeat-associated protein